MGHWYPLVVHSLTTGWRWRWTLLGTIWGVCIAGWLAVILTPNVYESRARLYVDADAVLTPLLRGLAIDMGTEGQLEVMRKTLMSRPNLEKVISATNFELKAAKPRDREFLVTELARTIKVEAVDKNIFTITYRNSDPHLARDVVSTLLSIFTEEAARTNRSGMDNAMRFLNEQIASYEEQLQTAERQRAEFRRKYFDILPLNGTGFSRLDAARLEMQRLEAQLKDATARLSALQGQLRVTPATLASETVASSQETQLAAAERQLADLRSRFTERHPDVIVAQRQVAALRASAARRPAATAGRALANPLYQQIRLQAIDAESTVSSLKARLETARSDRDRLEAMVQAAPGVEAEYQNLDRDYNVIRKNYEELLARRESSNITSAADTTADKTRLRVVDPPETPKIPVAPNRLLLISIVLVAGLGAGGGLAILLARLDQSISDIGRLRTVGLPVIGGISALPSPHRRASYARAVALTTGILALIAVYGALAAEIMSHPGLVPWIRTTGVFI